MLAFPSALSVCFSLLPCHLGTEAVHPLPRSHALTFQCSQSTIAFEGWRGHISPFCLFGPAGNAVLPTLVNACSRLFSLDYSPICCWIAEWVFWGSCCTVCLLKQPHRLCILCIKPSGLLPSKRRRESASLKRPAQLLSQKHTHLFPAFAPFFPLPP